MKTDKFQFTIGVTEGYFHNNENENINNDKSRFSFEKIRRLYGV